MVDLASLLDEADAAAPAFMAAVQGNILKPHGRNHAAHVFVRFTASAAVANLWLAEFAQRRVTTARAQAEQAAAWRSTGGSGEPFAALGLSAAGYAWLEIDESRAPQDPMFRAGMKFRDPAEGVFKFANLRLNDPPIERWEEPWQTAIHAIVQLADDNEARLDNDVTALERELADLGAVCFAERGSRLFADFGDRKGLDIEHFGHRDGISNPVFFKGEAEAERAARGATKWDPGAPLGLALVADGSGHGSYMVFRKLEQDVRRFDGARAELAQQLGLSTDQTSALIVGRAPDGTPAIPTVSPVPGAELNDFDFKGDQPEKIPGQHPRLCPFQAHIRKSNPRGDLPVYVGPDQDAERGFRIARRGIPYGPRPDLAPAADLPLPDSGVGLLFMSLQARIANFVIQQDGADFTGGFPVAWGGVDAVSGQRSAEAVAQSWPTADPAAPLEFPMFDFVRMRGGEFFFFPAMATLLGLAG